MPITNPPALNIIDQPSGQFLINFSVFFTDADPGQQIIIPGILDIVAQVFNIPLLNINSPIRGNFASVRSLLFCIESRFTGPTTPPNVINLMPLYIWNMNTNQVVSFLPGPGSESLPSEINGSVPFFCKSTDTLVVAREAGLAAHSVAASFTLATFDTSSYYTNSSNLFGQPEFS